MNGWKRKTDIKVVFINAEIHVYNVLFFLQTRMRERVGLKVVRALKRNDDGVTHAAIDMLGALMQVLN